MGVQRCREGIAKDRHHDRRPPVGGRDRLSKAVGDQRRKPPSSGTRRHSGPGGRCRQHLAGGDRCGEGRFDCGRRQRLGAGGWRGRCRIGCRRRIGGRFRIGGRRRGWRRRRRLDRRRLDRLGWGRPAWRRLCRASRRNHQRLADHAEAGLGGGGPASGVGGDDSERVGPRGGRGDQQPPVAVGGDDLTLVPLPLAEAAVGPKETTAFVLQRELNRGPSVGSGDGAVDADLNPGDHHHLGRRPGQSQVGPLRCGGRRGAWQLRPGRQRRCRWSGLPWLRAHRRGCGRRRRGRGRLARCRQRRVEVDRHRCERLGEALRVGPGRVAVGAGDGRPPQGVVDPPLKAVVAIAVGILLGPRRVDEVGMHAPAGGIAGPVGRHPIGGEHKAGIAGNAAVVDLQLQLWQQIGVTARAAIAAPVIGHVVFEVAPGQARPVPELREHHHRLQRQIPPPVTLRDVVVLGRGADVVPEDDRGRLPRRRHGTAGDHRQPGRHRNDLRRLQRLLHRVVGDRTVQRRHVVAAGLVQEARHPIDRQVARWCGSRVTGGQQTFQR